VKQHELGDNLRLTYRKWRDI